jgi:hypothetical protein
VKNVTKLFAVFIFSLLAGCGQYSASKNSDETFDKRLSELLDRREYFQLETKLKLLQDSIDHKQRLYFQAFIDNAFNRNEVSNNDIDTLFKNYFPGLTDSMKAALGLLQDDNYFKLYQYDKSARSIDKVLDKYQGALDSENISDIKNDLLIRNALKDVPPQATTIPDSTVIFWKKDKLGLFEIPVKSKGKTYDCIFDTRANISSISQTYAAKLGLKMLDVSYEEGSGITGIRFKTGLGIADSVYIGNILIRNVVFQVMPDSILYLAPVDFSLNVIIGLPVIEALKEIHIYKDGRMLIPLIQSKKALHNLALDRLDPVISVETGDDTLSFHLDLGASSSDLYYAYFSKYKQEILKTAFIKTIQLGGAGRVQKKDVYILPELNLRLENKNVTIDSIAVHSEKIYPSEKYYGNLGQDFTGQFNEIILNFTDMYFSAN